MDKAACLGKQDVEIEAGESVLKSTRIGNCWRCRMDEDVGEEGRKLSKIKSLGGLSFSLSHSTRKLGRGSAQLGPWECGVATDPLHFTVVQRYNPLPCQLLTSEGDRGYRR